MIRSIGREYRRKDQSFRKESNEYGQQGTYDVAETQAFDRVLVMEQGRIVEDAPPAQLLAQASRYRDLLEAERVVREDLWADARWQRLWLEDGELKEQARTDGRPDNKD